jgi:hypothetical protein
MHAIEIDTALGKAHPEPELSQRHQSLSEALDPLIAEHQNLTLELIQRAEE